MSDLVVNPEDRFSRVAAQLISVNKTKLIFPLQGKPYGITFIDHVVSKMFDYQVNVYIAPLAATYNHQIRPNFLNIKLVSIT